MRRLLAAMLSLLCVSTSTFAGDLLLRHVVVTDARLAALLANGHRRSETLSRLLKQVEASEWTVFVLNGPCPIKEAVGCLLHTVGRFEGRPYVRVKAQMGRHHPDVVLALVAHELQHAVEVATSGDVRDVHTMRALFRRIGSSNASTSGGRLFETAAATRAGHQVWHELRRVPSSAERGDQVKTLSASSRTGYDLSVLASLTHR